MLLAIAILSVHQYEKSLRILGGILENYYYFTTRVTL